jgi:beta-glucanase (GH16 family)
MGGAAGTGGVFGTGGGDVLDGGFGTGGAPGTGGGLGMGGSDGTGGAPGAEPSVPPDAPVDTEDAADAPERDVAMESGPESGPDGEPDRGEGDVGVDVPEAPVDTRDARDTRDTRDGRRDTVADVTTGLNLVWFDEFNAAKNTGVDTSKWKYITWGPGTVNNEVQQYTSSVANVFHDGEGHLVLRARYTPAAVNTYTSGRIDTEGISFGPGHRIEVRAKLPAGQGSFPGIIMLGTSGAWPDCGQLSLMEQYGDDKSVFYSTVYAGSAPGSGSTDKTAYAFPYADTASADFHVYSVDWYVDHVVFQVDGDEILSSSFDTSSPLYTITEYLVLDVALGGDMGKTINNTQFPMDMVIDYVHVYELPAITE